MTTHAATITMPTGKQDRHARRRSQTRAKLIDAAASLFARKGIDNTRINEITDEADVGFGSFYNHFGSKEDIVEAVFAETIAVQGEAIDRITAGLDDPAELVATAHRYYVELGRTEPELAWLLIRLSVAHGVALAALGRHAERDLASGIKAGRFQVANRRVAMLAAAGALVAVMRDVLDGKAPKDAARLHAEGVLRMFGLGPEEAAEVARRPLSRGSAPAGTA